MIGSVSKWGMIQRIRFIDLPYLAVRMTAAALRSKGRLDWFKRGRERPLTSSKLHCLKLQLIFALRVNVLKVRLMFFDIIAIEFCIFFVNFNVKMILKIQNKYQSSLIMLLWNTIFYDLCKCHQYKCVTYDSTRLRNSSSTFGLAWCMVEFNQFIKNGLVKGRHMGWEWTLVSCGRLSLG